MKYIVSRHSCDSQIHNERCRCPSNVSVAAFIRLWASLFSIIQINSQQLKPDRLVWTLRHLWVMHHAKQTKADQRDTTDLDAWRLNHVFFILNQHIRFPFFWNRLYSFTQKSSSLSYLNLMSITLCSAFTGTASTQNTYNYLIIFLKIMHVEWAGNKYMWYVSCSVLY